MPVLVFNLESIGTVVDGLSDESCQDIVRVRAWFDHLPGPGLAWSLATHTVIVQNSLSPVTSWGHADRRGGQSPPAPTAHYRTNPLPVKHFEPGTCGAGAKRSHHVLPLPR